ncbi:MAG: hypothetical protein ACRBF0_18465 [Calditrichia bacterium]
MRLSILLFICLFSSSCVEKIVYLPFPTSFAVVLNINVQNNNTFDVTETVNGLDIAEEIRNQLQGEFGFEEIRETKIEGMSFAILDTDNAHSAANASFGLSYDGSAEEVLFSVDGLLLGDSIGERKEISLNSNGVDLLNLALEDIVEGNSGSLVTVHVTGEAFPEVTRFTLLLEFTATPIVEQRVEIFDPF